MKKVLCLVLALLLVPQLCAPASAKASEPVDWALYTDIAAKINGHPIRSYNIGGATAVVAEDLRGYGFAVIWNAEERSLRISRAVRDWEAVQPEQWPDYQPEPLMHRIGARARAVYETDIATYAASERVDGFNIDGETLVWFDQLDRFGSVIWDEAARVIELTLDDPVALALEPMIQNVEDWRDFAGSGSGWETWERPSGTLLLTRYTGTPHGTSTGFVFVKKSGDKLNILNLLPAYGFGAAYYFNPSDIQLDEAGNRLRFVTPLPSEDGSGMRDALCTVDLAAGRLLSAEPLSEGLTEWSFSAPAPETPGSALSVTLSRKGAEVICRSAELPGSFVNLYLSADGMVIALYAASTLDESYQSSSFAAAWEALGKLALPQYESAENTAEQRDAAGRYLTVTCNGSNVSGQLWWSQGNNHRDLNMDFDKPLHLKDGDTVRVTLRNAE